MAGENLDISSDIGRMPPSGDGGAGPSPDAPGRRFVGIQFACCDVYTRVYVNRDETAYEGNCPRCLKPLRIRIGPGGTDHRFFTAY